MANSPLIKLLLSDIDGVMTDGGVAYDSQQAETKTFNIRDGLGIRLWQRTSRKFGVVTGRESPIVARRMAELDVAIVHQGVSEKLPAVERIAAEQGVRLAEVAYVGDDLPDLPVIRRVGIGVAVADAAEEVKAAANHVLETRGGRGAVRELVEVILKEAGEWEALVERLF